MESNTIQFPFGKHKGTNIEKIMINHPGYIDWLLRKGLDSKFKYIIEHINFCILRFDNKVFLKNCMGIEKKVRCSNIATRISLYPDNLTAYIWCDQCNPYQFGAQKGLTIISTYKEALDYVHYYCNNSNPDFKYLIKQLSELKGLTGRKTTNNILSFFHN